MQTYSRRGRAWLGSDLLAYHSCFLAATGARTTCAMKTARPIDGRGSETRESGLEKPCVREAGRCSVCQWAAARWRACSRGWRTRLVVQLLASRDSTALSSVDAVAPASQAAPLTGLGGDGSPSVQSDCPLTAVSRTVYMRRKVPSETMPAWLIHQLSQDRVHEGRECPQTQRRPRCGG